MPAHRIDNTILGLESGANDYVTVVLEDGFPVYWKPNAEAFRLDLMQACSDRLQQFS
jgi:hypothetical protein